VLDNNKEAPSRKSVIDGRRHCGHVFLNFKVAKHHIGIKVGGTKAVLHFKIQARA
jgi:hypothetical protein